MALQTSEIQCECQHTVKVRWDGKKTPCACGKRNQSSLEMFSTSIRPARGFPTILSEPDMTTKTSASSTMTLNGTAAIHQQRVQQPWPEPMPTIDHNSTQNTLACAVILF